MDIESNTGDYVLQSPKAISEAYGTLTAVEDVTSVIGFGNVPGEFNLQMNTEATFPAGASGQICNQSQNASCTGWLQFVYDSGGSINIQSWSINYGTCPSSLNLSGPQSSCGKRTAIFNLAPPLLKFSDLNGATLEGDVYQDPSTGNPLDAVELLANGHVSLATGTDITGAYGNWKHAQFDVYGNSGGDESVFNSGSLVAVQLIASTIPGSNPTCSNIGEGDTTGESTNLTLTPCTTLSSGIAFKEGVAPVIASLSATSGSQGGGNTVTLTAGTGNQNGTFVVNGFNPNVAVMFGGTRATVQGCTNTGTASTCTVTVPPGTGTNVPVTAANVFNDGSLGPASAPVLYSYYAPLSCQLAVLGCPAQGSVQEYQVSCPVTVNFSVEGAYQETGTSYIGVELPRGLSTAIDACVPSTSDCQGFSTTENQNCPMPPPKPPPVLTSCKVCIQNGQQCKRVPGGYVCTGVIQ